MSDEPKIMDVQFLAPARLTIEGQEGTVPVSIDLLNRKVYFEGTSTPSEYWTKKVFEFLDRVHTLPEDFFSAPEEVQQRAQQAYDDIETNKNTVLGDIDGW